MKSLTVFLGATLASAADNCQYKCDSEVKFADFPEKASPRIEYNDIIFRVVGESRDILDAGLVKSAADAAVQCCTAHAPVEGKTNYFQIRNFIGLPYASAIDPSYYEMACFETSADQSAADVPDFLTFVKEDAAGVAVGMVNQGNCTSQSSLGAEKKLNIYGPLRGSNPRSSEELRYYCNEITLGTYKTNSYIPSTIWDNSAVPVEHFKSSDMLAADEGCSQGEWTPLAYKKEPMMIQMPDVPAGGFLEAAAFGRVGDAAARCCLESQLNGDAFAIRAEAFFTYGESVPLYWSESFCYGPDSGLDLYQISQDVTIVKSIDGLPTGVLSTGVSSGNLRNDRLSRSVYSLYNCSDILFRPEYGTNSSIPSRMYFVATGSATQMAAAVVAVVFALFI